MSDEIELADIYFDVGDRVKFECCDLDNSKPRWHFNDDMGESGLWAKGMVTFVDERVIQVQYRIHGFDGKGYSTWPNREHDDYIDLQWFLDGYLQVVKRKADCECGAEVTYGVNTPHVSWCPKYEEI